MKWVPRSHGLNRNRRWQWRWRRRRLRRTLAFCNHRKSGPQTNGNDLTIQKRSQMESKSTLRGYCSCSKHIYIIILFYYFFFRLHFDSYFSFFILPSFFSASTFECASQCVSAAQWCAEDTSTTSLNGNKFAEWMCRWERVWAGQPTTRTRSCAASGYIEQSTKHNNEWALKRLRKVERCSTYFRAANTHTPEWAHARRVQNDRFAI